MWENRKWGQVNYHVTQILKRHGWFNAYLLRFKKRDDAVCMYCGHHRDDVEHTFFDCDRWWQQRRELEVKLVCDVTPETISEAMTASKSKWEAVKRFIITILSRKEVDERNLQATAVVNLYISSRT
jgi:hypothetical protein